MGRLTRVVTAVLFIAACVTAAPAGATEAPDDSQARVATATGPVVVIFFENRSYGEIIGNPCCPFINARASKGRLYDNYWAVGRLSLPNYLAFAGGSTCGKGPSDGVTPYCNQRNLWDQLHRAGIDWRVWQESMPSPCLTSDSGLYVVRHNPEAVYADQVGTGMCARHDVALPDSISALSPFTFVTPNLCNDMHSCSSTRGDRWFQKWLPRFLAVPKTRVIVTFDEGTVDNHVPAFEVGAGVPTVVNHTRFTHYSLLAGVEVAFGLRRLANAATAIRLPV
jgi:acid phosphatase